ncbi:procathepsin L-like isoform X2 [Coccinella septempunctata]|uniref:procathepsin L-like isoform X1 n=1 Tax=Coccinella septempunctata TaxID=41139 RepID=UPI001D0850AF|nr:procathepsin L-like isoform X1 [Coccinella septempunctata]XP_044758251.1 procathepsin L-like isoform X2 [Coccinella septempunctata]
MSSFICRITLKSSYQNSNVYSKMKLIIFAACIISSLAFLPDEVVYEEWVKFLEKYQKSYRSNIQFYKRQMVFRKNLEHFYEHNKLFEEGKVTYTKGINKFSDLTPEEFAIYVQEGLLKYEYEHIDGGEYTGDDFTKQVEYVDWREKGAVSHVRDEGICAPCYAISAAEAIEGQLKIVKGISANISVQNLVDCTREQGNLGCSGGLVTNCYEYVKQHGIETEKDYPPVGHETFVCGFNQTKSVAQLKTYMKVSKGSEKALRNAIAEIGPISVGMDFTVNLMGYKSGIFDDESCDSNKILHTALAVGYGTENGVDFYIVKNVFGADWGENGYFRIVRNKNNRCGIASMATFPVLA